MSYERHFSKDWTRLDRDEAMVRAYALGVDAALGTEHPEEYQRLLRADKRALIEMAFNEGRRKALQMEQEIDTGTTDEDDDDDEREYEIWNRLLVIRRPDQEDELGGDAPRTRIDIPLTLQRMALLENRRDDLKRLRLPDFLYR